MGLFDRIFQPRKLRVDAQTTFSTLTAYQPVFTSWNGMLYESELCRSSIDAIARHCSKLKVEFKGEAKPKLRTAMRFKPNPFQTWQQFLYRTATILYCTNSCFLVPLLDKNMETVGFFPILPDNAKLVEVNGQIWIRYTFRNGQVGAIEYDKCAVLTRFQYQSDFFGDTNKALDDTMGLIHLSNQGIKEAVKSGATHRFIAKLNNFAKPEDIAKEASRWTKNNFSAESRDSSILLFPNTYTDIKEINPSAYVVDEKQMNYIRSNVERYFGVNEKVLNNSANGEELDAFFNGCLEIFAIQLSEAMSSAIFTPLERSYGSYVLVDANRLQYMSTSQKVQMAKELGDRGMLTINEMRELFNYPPIENGDQAVIRGEYYSLDDKIGGEDGTKDNEEL